MKATQKDEGAFFYVVSPSHIAYRCNSGVSVIELQLHQAASNTECVSSRVSMLSARMVRFARHNVFLRARWWTALAVDRQR